MIGSQLANGCAIEHDELLSGILEPDGAAVKRFFLGGNALPLDSARHKPMYSILQAADTVNIRPMCHGYGPCREAFTDMCLVSAAALPDYPPHFNRRGFHVPF